MPKPIPRLFSYTTVLFIISTNFVQAQYNGTWYHGADEGLPSQFSANLERQVIDAEHDTLYLGDTESSLQSSNEAHISNVSTNAQTDAPDVESPVGHSIVDDNGEDKLPSSSEPNEDLSGKTHDPDDDQEGGPGFLSKYSSLIGIGSAIVTMSGLNRDRRRKKRFDDSLGDHNEDASHPNHHHESISKSTRSSVGNPGLSDIQGALDIVPEPEMGHMTHDIQAESIYAGLRATENKCIYLDSLLATSDEMLDDEQRQQLVTLYGALLEEHSGFLLALETLNCPAVGTRVASPGAPFTCLWEGCSRTFEYEYQLNLRSKHAQSHQKPISCEICDYRCATRRDLGRHRRTNHPDLYGREEFACEMCKPRKVFGRKDHLKRHVDNIHTFQRYLRKAHKPNTEHRKEGREGGVK
ncbi:hypothetical protein M426DRAFT_28383 [Hypoxylon sp. CI-4A]|nr:hypothetical protein M426DRAFT_28383 [Hypoxylon sp. CI-4A]